MNRFSLAVVASGLAVSSVLASQGQGRGPDRFGGRGGSAPLIPALAAPTGATQRGGGSYRSPGTEGATFEVETPQTATVVEEHYRKQLLAAGWKVESSGGDADIAFSRFTVPAPGSARAGMMAVTPLPGGRFWVALRLNESVAVPAPPAPRTESEMMDWMLRQLPRADTGAPPVATSQLPDTFPTELLPPGLKRSRILSTGNYVTVAGTVDNAKPSDLPAFVASLRRAGWSDRLHGRFTENFEVFDFCKNDTRASIVFNLEPTRVVMAGVNINKTVELECQVLARQSPGISAPVVVVPARWSPIQGDGSGGSGGSGRGAHWRSGMRLNTSIPIAAIAADIEAQITASGYKAVARTSDANQRHVRFVSTQVPGASAVLLLTITKLPWSPQVDAVYELVTRQTP